VVDTWAELKAKRGSKFGVKGNVAVTNAAGGNRILVANPRRISFIVVNNEANAAHVQHAPNPTTALGKRLDAAGGFLSMSLEEDGTIVQDELWGILETAAGNLHVEEVEGAGL